MHKRFATLNLFIGSLIVSHTLGMSAALAEAKPLRGIKAQARQLSVIDYFKLLPFYGIGDSTTRKQRRELLQFGTDPDTNPTIDVRNDYLLIHPDSSPAEQIAVFRAHGKSDVVAVSMPDSESDYNDFTLYRLQNGKLRDVTRQVLPVPLRIDNFLYVLPENGTTIRVFKFNMGDVSGRHAFDLQWRGGRFVKVR